MSAQIEVLENKYKDLRKRIVEELDKVESRLEYYSSVELDKQTEVMQGKYKDRQEKLFAELDKVDTRLQSYSSMKKKADQIDAQPAAITAEPKKMYRGRPIA